MDMKDKPKLLQKKIDKLEKKRDYGSHDRNTNGKQF